MVEKESGIKNMKKCVLYDKLSKKGKKQVDAKARRTFDDFGCLSPITKIIPDKKKDSNRKCCRKQVK